MSQVDEDNFHSLHKKLIRGKDKNDTFLKQKEFALEIKPKRRSGLQTMEIWDKAEQPPAAPYNEISDDVWYLISRYIPPEYVKTFALICRQTANVVNTKGFWSYLYRTYCQKRKKTLWNPMLPERLQYINIIRLDLNEMRQCVIESLFICCENFANRLENYDPDFLVKKTYFGSWVRRSSNCGWIAAFKFDYCPFIFGQCHMPGTYYFEPNPEDVVDDWESLVNNNNNNTNNNNSKSYELDRNLMKCHGACYLIVYAKWYTPLPPELYNYEEPCWRVACTRRLLSADLRGQNLEIDFEHVRNKSRITLRYSDVTKYKIIPWWHPKYRDMDEF